jgi:hypothetical protein
MKPTIFAGFPDTVNPENYFLSTYLQGENLCETKGLSYDHFDMVSFFRESKCQLTKRDIVHAIGSRDLEKQNVILILRKRVNSN